MEEVIKNEVNRCLNCRNPRCVEACPLHVNIPQMINELKQGKIKEAFEVDNASNPFGLICGLVCPHEKQCQGACIRGIKDRPIEIGKIENYICNTYISKTSNDILSENKKSKVAIIGGGPAGLSCAYVLSKAGINSTIFERENFLGGILMYGIPDYRLDKENVKKNIGYLLNDKIEEKYNSDFSARKHEGKISIDKLKEDGYEYIFIAIGLNKNKGLDIPGIDNKNVIFASNYLRDYFENSQKRHGVTDKLDEEVLVVGGGNVAIDAARTANKLCKSSTIVYRRTREKMPANNIEIEEAIEEGVNFIFETNITKIDANGERILATLNDEKELECDKIILAIGNKIDKNDFDDFFEYDEYGLIKVDENNMTNHKNIYAGGDLTQNKNTVAFAIKSGINVANDIIKNINELHK